MSVQQKNIMFLCIFISKWLCKGDSLLFILRIFCCRKWFIIEEKIFFFLWRTQIADEDQPGHTAEIATEAFVRWAEK